ncbi:hypothetical protein LCGC14_1379780 [marine sediment metagenome]|uniref:ATP-dependent Clp protease proteolytic subunit n=1 Tax=marine sediment metagenome TaxID=412755 RepID=A0A0F9KNV8_9ZZZZ
MSSILRDDVDKFFDYGINIPTRTLYIGSTSYLAEGDESGVDHEMTERAVKGIHLLDSHAKSGDKPFTIIMNNPGGDWYHGVAIYDAITTSRNHITVKVYGHAMSMGAVILQAADERLIAPNARLMIHYGTMGYDSHSKIYQKWAEESKRMDRAHEDIFLEQIREKRPKFSRIKLQAMMNFDTFFSAKEAIELGLADKIIVRGDKNE